MMEQVIFRGLTNFDILLDLIPGAKMLTAFGWRVNFKFLFDCKTKYFSKTL